MSRKIPQNVLAQGEDPFFGRDIQHSPDMDAVDVFGNLRCQKHHYKQKALARANPRTKYLNKSQLTHSHTKEQTFKHTKKGREQILKYIL